MMTEKPELSIEPGSPLGIAIMAQVLSAILIIGGTLYFGPPSSEMLWLVVVGVLYAIGFVQLLLTRYLLQREKNGIIAAGMVAILAMLFAFVNTLVWSLIVDLMIPAVFYLIIFAINVTNVGVLRKERSMLSA
jgi:hypothetical protein